MTDREAIAELLVRYARALDQRDWDALRRCFTDDAQAEYSGTVLPPGVDAIVDHVRQLEHLAGSSHLAGNILIDLDGDEAFVLSQGLVHLVLDGGVRVRSVYYTDRVARQDGQWRIRERRHRAAWSVDLGGTHD
jgi:ketosteroid isomerase-like protein